MSNAESVSETPYSTASNGRMGCGMYSVQNAHTVMNNTALSVETDM